MLPEPLDVSRPTIAVANHYPSLRFSSSRLKKFFGVIFSAHLHHLSGELSIVFMDRDTHSQLHGKYMQDYRPTDVITFPGDPEHDLTGEICISVDQALHEVKERDIPLIHELSLYLIHGWLHLVGFDDLDPVDRKIMRQEEERLLELIKKHEAWPDFQLAPEYPEG